MKTIFSRSFVLSLALGSLFGLSGCAEFFDGFQAKTPAPDANADPKTAVASASSTSSGSEATPPQTPPDEQKPKVNLLKLDSFGFPLTIEQPEGTPLKPEVGRPETLAIGDLSTAFQGWVYKVDPKARTITQAKDRKKVLGCDSTKVVKEGPDYYIFTCKTRSGEMNQLLMIRELGGVAYSCESWATAVEDLDARLETCRTLRPM